MKKPARSVLFMALMFLCGIARAQSSVTLYGIVGDGFNFTSNNGGHRAYQLVNGNAENSRWGFRGAEDLGGGYQAIFRLENGFNVNNGALGQGGREFGRQAYVGISSDRYGTLTLGRQYDPTLDLYSGFTVGASFIGALGIHPLDNDNTGYDFRVNNSVKYLSSSYRGVNVEGMYGFSDGTAGLATNRLYSAGIGYSLNAFKFAVAFLRLSNPGSASGAVTTDSVFTGSSEQNIVAGLSYSFSSTILKLAYSHVDVYGPTAAAYLPRATTQIAGGRWNSWKFDNIEVNGQYYLHPDLWAGLAYTFTIAKLDATNGHFVPKWHQLTATLDYDLSKRSAVYIQGAYVHLVSANTGTAFDTPEVPVATTAASSSPNQVVVRVGFTQRF